MVSYHPSLYAYFCKIFSSLERTQTHFLWYNPVCLVFFFPLRKLFTPKDYGSNTEMPMLEQFCKCHYCEEIAASDLITRTTLKLLVFKDSNLSFLFSAF